jgi:hypothetical protein
MISRRGVVHGLAGLMIPTLAGCGGTPPRAPVASLTAGAYPPPALSPDGSWRPAVDGLDAVIDISHNVQVSDFRAVRSVGVLAVIHKTSEGGDWFDPSYASRRREAEQSGLLWGGYHFGTRQYSGARQAEAFHANHKEKLCETLGGAISDYAQLEMLAAKIMVYLFLQQRFDYGASAHGVQFEFSILFRLFWIVPSYEIDDSGLRLRF